MIALGVLSVPLSGGSSLVLGVAANTIRSGSNIIQVRGERLTRKLVTPYEKVPSPWPAH